MYQNLRKKLEEVSALYYEEEILWLLDHMVIQKRQSVMS